MHFSHECLRVLMSTHGATVCCSLPPLVQVEEPDPANHTDTRNPATYAEKKGVYIALVGVPIVLKVFFLLRHFSKQLPVCSQDTTEPMETHFLLADNVYCKASVPPTDKVCLWLGVSKNKFILIFKCVCVFICFSFYVLIVGLETFVLWVLDEKQKHG